MERHELMDKIQDIQDKNYNLFKGVNEADLATREDIADLFKQLINERVVELSSNESVALPLHNVSNRRELLLDFSYKLRKLLNFTHQQPLDKYVDYYEEGKL